MMMAVLLRHMKGSEILMRLKEDIQKGWLQKELRTYKGCFTELSIQKGVILQGNRTVIPNSLRRVVLNAAHLGHPRKESVTRHIRQSCWWPGMSVYIREYAEMCLPCVATVSRTPDFNHLRYQSARDIGKRSLCMFHKSGTPQRQVTTIKVENNECQEEIRNMIKGLEGAVQIEDNIVIHRKGKEY